MDVDFNQLLAEAARELAAEPTIVTTVERAVELCRETVPGCASAAISVVENGSVTTLAATDDAVRLAESLQADLGQGPCQEPVANHEVLNAPDLSHDPRWPSWGPRVAAEAGLCSLLAFPLFTTSDTRGLLSLYGASAGSFDGSDQLEGQVLAAHASVALATSVKERQLTRALESRTVIGQATGILIERFGLTADQAFAVMRRVSQNHNVKLHALAEHLVRTGVLLSSGPYVDGEAAPRPEPGLDGEAVGPPGA